MYVSASEGYLKKKKKRTHAHKIPGSVPIYYFLKPMLDFRF